MKAVTGVGAPSYASGAHMWNGTAATLKPNATTSMKPPAITRPGFCVCASAVCILIRLDVPAAPYRSAMPYTRKPVANAPIRKYFIAASLPRRDDRRIAVIT